MSLPIIALTMGDPAGIGPEVVVKTMAEGSLLSYCQPLAIGSASVFEWTTRQLGIPAEIERIGQIDTLRSRPGVISVLNASDIEPRHLQMGRVSAEAGAAAMAAVTHAAESALRGQVAALATAPINKEAIKLAGYADIGHMEFLARLSGAQQYATMLTSGPLRVVHLTTHLPLHQAVEAVSQERVVARLTLIHDQFRRWGMEKPRIGVAALNPHGGEGGLLGREELEMLEPAVAETRDRGIDARGPFPADSIFYRAIHGDFDVVLAMYHDQGHIPIKVYGFEASVSVALGLPIVRTSVDHGTAFDIAGQGKADPTSMIEAVKVAALICQGHWLQSVPPKGGRLPRPSRPL